MPKKKKKKKKILLGLINVHIINLHTRIHYLVLIRIHS